MYEITFIAKNEKDVIVRKTVEMFGGKVLNSYSLGRKKLSYKIKKQTAGFYEVITFEIKSDKLPELEKKLLLEPEILRFLVAKKLPARHVVLKKKEKETIKAENIQMIDSKKKAEIKPEPKKEMIEEKKKTVEIEAPVKDEAIAEAEEKTQFVKKTVKPPAPQPKVKEMEATEEERLEALEEKLSELLKE